MPTALTVRKIDGKPGEVYYPLEHKTIPSRAPEDNEVTIKMLAAALNHRDLFIRQSLYPGVAFGVPLLADGCGVVTATGASAKEWAGKRVILNPGTGWKDSLDGPEDKSGYKILGGTKATPVGCAIDELVIDASEIEEVPTHLDDLQAAALPLAGLTAWRATVVKTGNAKPGRNILVTGIGGGVAIMALLFAVKAGCNVYVTSGSPEKMQRAKDMGAKGGVNYKDKDWEKQLLAMLPSDRKELDAIVDGAGGDVVAKGAKLLKAGGVISQYGMTVGPKMTWAMNAVLKNIELRGSTMGSRKEFADMVAFVKEKDLVPIVSKVANGLDNMPEIESLFDEIKKGSQFGKLVIKIDKNARTSNL